MAIKNIIVITLFFSISSNVKSQFLFSISDSFLNCKKNINFTIKNVSKKNYNFFVSIEFYKRDKWQEFDNDILGSNGDGEKWIALNSDSIFSSKFVITNCLESFRRKNNRIKLRLVINYGINVDYVKRKKYYSGILYLK